MQSAGGYGKIYKTAILTDTKGDRAMNRKRLGQVLIGGVFTLCAAAVLSLIELVEKEETNRAATRARKNAEAGGDRSAPGENP